MVAAGFFRRAARFHGSAACRALAIVGASVASGIHSPNISAAEDTQRTNRRLSQRHRIAITTWSIYLPRDQAGLDETSKALRGDFEGLLWFLKEHGYEGIEITIPDLRFGGYFPDYLGDEEIACAVSAACAKTGMNITGSLLHIADGAPLGPTYITGLDFQSPDFWDRLRQVLEQERAIGSQYATFQIDLPESSKGTGGAYRNDEEFLRLSASRVARMQEICFSLGMNFYVEAHIDRISEDPEAFCKIFEYCPTYFEVNADISHYLYRNICRGPHYDQIMARVGHCHIRMARKHGDLSSDVGIHMGHMGTVGDPAEDWEDKGVTWQAVEAMRPALERGLSSGLIVGEAGPAFSVRDALLLDTKLVPLYRFMASIADGGQPQGNPWSSE